MPTFEDVMKYLEKNNTGTDYDIAMMQNFNNGEEITDYEQDYNITPDEIRDLFD